MEEMEEMKEMEGFNLPKKPFILDEDEEVYQWNPRTHEEDDSLDDLKE
jgi:hypothetical protein